MDLYSLCSIAASLCLAGIQVVTDAPELSVIAGAAAQVACEVRTNLVIGGVGILTEQSDGVHYKTRVTEAALVGTLVSNEANKIRGFLLQTFQRADLVAVSADSQSGAGQDGGGSRLTPEGKRWLQQYEAYRDACVKASQELYRLHFPKIGFSTSQFSLDE